MVIEFTVNFFYFSGCGGGLATLAIHPHFLRPLSLFPSFLAFNSSSSNFPSSLEQVQQAEKIYCAAIKAILLFIGAPLFHSLCLACSDSGQWPEPSCTGRALNFLSLRAHFGLALPNTIDLHTVHTGVCERERESAFQSLRQSHC